MIARFSTTEGLVRRLLITSMLFGFACLLAAGGAAAWLTVQTREHSEWVNHTYEVELAIDRARILIEQSETARRGYLLTADPAYVLNYREAAVGVPGAINRVEQLTRDNEGQRPRVAALRRWVSELLLQRQRSIALIGSGRAVEGRALFVEETGAGRMREIRALATALANEEKRLLAIRDKILQDSLRAFFIVLAVAGALLVLVALTALATVLRYTRDLDRSSQAIKVLNEGLEAKVQERTADLTRANEEIQRFAYIVSHDLRSPLVNVMGFTAELDAATKTVAALIDRAEIEAPQIVTREAEMAAREDLPEAIRFIRTSTAKMDRLINAILKLSREGRRVLVPEPLDMRQLTGGIRDSLAQLAEDRGAEITVETMPDLRSDRLAIEQILSNLMENAVKYLQDGRPGRIAVRGRAETGKLIYEVEDNGRGIASGDHQRVFDLFRRAGKQDQAGEGIGLAHVRALAYRLGGNVTVASTLGEGSVFRLILPAHFDDRGEAEDGK